MQEAGGHPALAPHLAPVRTLTKLGTTVALGVDLDVGSCPHLPLRPYAVERIALGDGAQAS